MKKVFDSFSNSDYYNKVFMDYYSRPLFNQTKLINKKVPSWITIKIPYLRKHECDDIYECSGWIIGLREIKLFKIGTHIEKLPFYPKIRKTGKKITFKRYGQ